MFPSLRKSNTMMGSRFSMHSEMAAAISIELGIRGPYNVLSNGCSSGLDALGFGYMAVSSGLAMGSWLADAACLVAAFLSVGAGVPWRGLLLAYGAGQLAANLPLTPGGLGVVEGSLSVALVAYGGGEVPTIAAVLLYRIVSFWLFLPVGWTAWAVLEYQRRR